jgi:hypothetical protein
VVLNQGFPNKNIGDAFLIVEEDCSRQYQQGTEYIPKLQYPKLLETIQVAWWQLICVHDRLDSLIFNSTLVISSYPPMVTDGKWHQGPCCLCKLLQIQR